MSDLLSIIDTTTDNASSTFTNVCAASWENVNFFSDVDISSFCGHGFLPTTECMVFKDIASARQHLYMPFYYRKTFSSSGIPAIPYDKLQRGMSVLCNHPKHIDTVGVIESVHGHTVKIVCSNQRQELELPMSNFMYFTHCVITKAIMLSLVLKEEMAISEVAHEPLICAPRILFDVVKMAMVDTTSVSLWQEWSGTTALPQSELISMLQNVFPNIAGMLCSWSLYLKDKFDKDPTSEYTIFDVGHLLSDLQLVITSTRSLATLRANLYTSYWQGVLQFSSRVMGSDEFWPLIKLFKIPKTHSELLHFHSSNVFKVVCSAASTGNRHALDITTMIGDAFFSESINATSSIFRSAESALQYPVKSLLSDALDKTYAMRKYKRLQLSCKSYSTIFYPVVRFVGSNVGGGSQSYVSKLFYILVDSNSESLLALTVQHYLMALLDVLEAVQLQHKLYEGSMTFSEVQTILQTISSEIHSLRVLAATRLSEVAAPTVSDANHYDFSFSWKEKFTKSTTLFRDTFATAPLSSVSALKLLYGTNCGFLLAVHDPIKPYAVIIPPFLSRECIHAFLQEMTLFIRVYQQDTMMEYEPHFFDDTSNGYVVTLDHPIRILKDTMQGLKDKIASYSRSTDLMNAGLDDSFGGYFLGYQINSANASSSSNSSSPRKKKCKQKSKKKPTNLAQQTDGALQSSLLRKKQKEIASRITQYRSTTHHKDESEDESECKEVVAFEQTVLVEQTAFEEHPKQEYDDDDTTCIICLDQPRDMLFLPCRHLISCSNCGKQCKECPKCRCTIASVIEVIS